MSSKQRERREPQGRRGAGGPQGARPQRRRWGRAGAGLLLVGLAAGGAAVWLGGGGGVSGPGARGDAGPPATYVGTATCASCHAREHQAWQGSHHALAMQEAREGTVLGDFDDARLTHAGVTTTFFRRDGKFLVRTDGPDGRLAEFEVKYTFGISPLQQYLVELPGGRIQALPIAWDTRPREEGGQRWFHLYPDERIDHTDELHWTGPALNWNFMCADCHSTGVRKNYDASADRFRTTWSEINVGCEACHGPGSRHVEWAERVRAGKAWVGEGKGLVAALIERKGVRWVLDPASGNARRSVPRTTDAEIEVCAQCHSRRSQLDDGHFAGAPLLDRYLPSLLLPGLYHADGQQRDEVYTYGSFVQSKMYARGVTCSDCHDPHSQRLRAPGNQVCAQCHAPSKYDTPSHHFHPPTSAGAQCVSCHMPPTTYMVIDPRRDHSIRVPRPDFTVKLGVPNACNGCHVDRSAAWAAAQVRAWYGRDPSGYQDFAEAFHADERGQPRAAEALAAIAGDTSRPWIVRASALARLGRHPGTAALEAARAGVADPNPMVRHAALAVLEHAPLHERIGLAVPLLGDPSRVVRIQAAWALAPAANLLNADQRSRFDRAAEELIASLRYNADRPESRTTLGTFFAQLGRYAEAEAEYRAALELSRSYVPAPINLADLYRALGREPDAERVLRDALAAVPHNAALHHALGLSLARSGRLAEAIAELARAATLAPDDPRFVYAYAVALHSSGRARAAIRTLEEALGRHPGDREILFALATFHRDAGERAAALRYAEMLANAHPGDAEARALLASLQDRDRS